MTKKPLNAVVSRILALLVVILISNHLLFLYSNDPRKSEAPTTAQLCISGSYFVKVQKRAGFPFKVVDKEIEVEEQNCMNTDDADPYHMSAKNYYSSWQAFANLSITGLLVAMVYAIFTKIKKSRAIFNYGKHENSRH